MHSILPNCSPFLNFEFLRVLGTAPLLGSDVAECLEAATKIRSNDPESWYRAWTDAAEQSEAVAKDALAAGDKLAALWAFLRSSNYRRSSEFLLHGTPNDPRLLSATEKSVANFRSACGLMSSPVHFLDIPYVDVRGTKKTSTTLPGYLYLPTATGPRGKSPVIINTGGLDSIQEELYYFTASGARTRGYATLSFEGPGQGIVVRRDKVHLRPDWEVVIGAVLDHLAAIAEEHPEWQLDLDRVAVMGVSMGGYFALRGAMDPRISACVAIDGFYDLGGALRERLPPILTTAIDKGWLSDRSVNALLGLAGRLNFQSGWEFAHAMWVMGVASPAEMLRELSRYSLRSADGKTTLSQIKAPVLVSGARDFAYFPLESGARSIYRDLAHLGDKDQERSLWIPTGVGRGSLQAKVGALSSLHGKVFGWLDEVFRLHEGSEVLQHTV
ncbi:alpha/beta hydrolase [Podospora aff. communis PSN243]|uniref:Alpha/beta hydrolase n=1 Tax=Podospora aff. communis PSN243 TaxID=3040156 RepID=A0AAV9GQB3_9PEZI|nr:alpha/beta hydrolase [Podospora aff. communis PSN243]